MTATRYKIREDLLVEEVDGECVILDMERNVYFGLEAIGLAIWTSLERGQHVEQIRAALVQKYGEGTRAKIERDLDAFIADLLARHLIEPL